MTSVIAVVTPIVDVVPPFLPTYSALLLLTSDILYLNSQRIQRVKNNTSHCDHYHPKTCRQSLAKFYKTGRPSVDQLHRTSHSLSNHSLEVQVEGHQYSPTSSNPLRQQICDHKTGLYSTVTVIHNDPLSDESSLNTISSF